MFKLLKFYGAGATRSQTFFYWCRNRSEGAASALLVDKLTTFSLTEIQSIFKI